MAPADRPIHLDLTLEEARILVQSLENCLSTCRARAKQPDAPCPDCDAARELKKKLQFFASYS